MKPITQNAFITPLVAYLMMTLPALAQTGGDYEISWSTIDGGG